MRILADEQLTGASREAVQARLDLWIKAHIDKQLGALTLLAAAEDITGIARGVAFQLVESLGVLERQKVAEEVKGLDQPSRAVLRKYGVRFGAYHIYIPPLAETGAAPAGDAALCAQARARRHQRSGGDPAFGRERTDLDPGRSGDRRRRSIASPASVSAASARSGSTFWSGWPI